MSSKITNIITSSVQILFFVIMACVIMGTFGDVFWVFDLFSHWQLQYLALTILIIVVNVIFCNWRFAFFALCCILYLVYPFLDTNRVAVSETDIYYVNAYYKHTDLDRIVDEFVEIQPKIVSIVELPEGLGKKMNAAGFETVYEHYDGVDSMGLYVREDVEGVTGEVLTDGVYPIGVAATSFGMIYTIHPHPPLSKKASEDQKNHFRQVGELIREKGVNFTLVGDFNSTVFSPVFQQNFDDFYTEVNYTWNYMTPIALPIDYAVSNKIFLAQKGADIGSDHRGLMIDILR